MEKYLALFLAIVSVAVASDVLEYTDSDFSTRVAEEDVVLVEFFAPWCGHCKKLAPEYEQAATILKANDPPVALAKVDCTANQDACQKHGVSGYPTLKIFRGGELSGDYQGPREANGIVKHMRGQVGAASKEVKSVEEMEKFLENSVAGIIGFFDSETDLYKIFKKTADSFREEYRFAHTFDSAVGEKYGHKNNVVLFRPKRLTNKFEPDSVVYDGDDTVSSVKQFISDKLHGLAGHRTRDSEKDFKKPLVVVYYNVDYVRNQKGSNYWRNRVMKVAQKFEGETIYFAISSSDDFMNELEEFGLKYKEKPVAAARNVRGEKFAMTEEFSMDTLEAFVQDLLANKLTPYLKSESIPADNDEPVKVVVAKQFDEIVNDESKDVLIEFYAPWCGHCKQLTPKYEELATKLKDETDIVIAKMDATANDVPAPYDVRGFPTIYWAPKGQKQKPQKYESGREVEDFLPYIAQHSTNQLKGWDRKGKKMSKEEL
ncbi:PREDICTED: protein disulfide-isomerase A3-like [Priapulus caudatus]|uniref:Protein disulfide-isomerase n=1 Tax=Priapulus caudatus TaxID=37621 RepID=A0ABM1DR07_PRICU|nr:PREDICTED: protein disulfide-isomerase A3-like [Priapulus caudatus]